MANGPFATVSTTLATRLLRSVSPRRRWAGLPFCSTRLDDDIAAVLGLYRSTDFTGVDPHDREHPDALLLVATSAVVPPFPAVSAPVLVVGPGQPTQFCPCGLGCDR